MLRYAEIVNEETKLCNVGVGTNVDYYKSIGFTEMEVEQGYDGNWYVKGYAPQESIEEKNEAIKQARASQYATLIDPLHAEKQRKVVLGTWTEEMEAEYVAKVKELTEQIQTENPYIDSVEVLH